MAQRWRRGRFNMTMAGGVRDFLERVRHSHELIVVPRAPQQLDVDGLSVVVVTNGENNRRNPVRRTWRVTATEASLAAAAVVEADVAQEPGVDDGVNASMVGAGSVHPRLCRCLAPSPIVPKRLYLRGRQPWRRRGRACARISADVGDLFLRAVHVDHREDLEALGHQLRMTVDIV